MSLIRCIFMSLFVLFICAACNEDAVQDNPNDDSVDSVEETSFFATVVEVNNALLVQPLEDETEARSADLISVGTNEAKLLDEEGNDIGLNDLQDGITVEIVYDGMIMESYPAQITSFQVQIVDE